MFGARFDLAFKSLADGNLKPPSGQEAIQEIKSKYEGSDEL